MTKEEFTKCRASKHNDENEIFTVGFQHQIFHSPKMRTGTMTQPMPVLAIRLFSLNSIVRTKMVEGEDQISQVVF